MSELKRQYNIPDFKNEKGLWVRSYRPIPKIVHSTRSGTLWAAVQYRTKEGNKIAEKIPTYIGCENHFTEYQRFADWCQDQFGYMNRDSRGYFWSLDKDFINHGNKIYSEENCIFVPCSVNSLITNNTSQRGLYPLGVILFNKEKGVYRADCRSLPELNKKKFSAYFYNPEDAHRAYQLAKIEVFKDYLQLPYMQGHTKFINAVEGHIQRIKDDHDNHRQTFF